MERITLVEIVNLLNEQAILQVVVRDSNPTRSTPFYTLSVKKDDREKHYQLSPSQAAFLNSKLNNSSPQQLKDLRLKRVRTTKLSKPKKPFDFQIHPAANSLTDFFKRFQAANLDLSNRRLSKAIRELLTIHPVAEKFSSDWDSSIVQEMISMKYRDRAFIAAYLMELECQRVAFGD